MGKFCHFYLLFEQKAVEPETGPCDLSLHCLERTTEGTTTAAMILAFRKPQPHPLEV